MNSPDESNEGASPARAQVEPPGARRGAPSTPPQRLSRFVKVLVVGAGTIAVVYGFVWWQDRPIREIQQTIELKQPELALAQADFYLRTKPDDVRVLALKARALLDSGKTAEAVALFEKIGLANSSEMYLLAQGYMKLSQWSRAIPLLTQAMTLEPTNADMLQDLIGCQFQMGMHSQGLANADALSKLPGHQARGLSWRAFFLNAGEDRIQALAAFAQTLRVSPDAQNLPVSAAEFLLRYGQALVADEKLNEARPMIERSIAAVPSAMALATLAQIQDRSGEQAEAFQNFNRALELDPSQPDACEALAAQALADGDLDTARRRLAPLAARPFSRFKTIEILLVVFEKSGDVAEARRCREHLKQMEAREKVDDAVKRLLRRAPESFWANVVRAHDFAASGNWTQAQAVLEPFQQEASKEPFVQELWKALVQRGSLPALERLPLDTF